MEMMAINPIQRVLAPRFWAGVISVPLLASDPPSFFVGEQTFVGGWLSSGVHGTVKFTLDMAIGETSRIESTDKDKVETLVQKVRDLNSRLQDVRREQVFQRVSRTPTDRCIGARMLANTFCSSAKPNSATSPSIPTPVSFAGPSSNL